MRIPIGEAVVAVTVEDETDKINPNVASTQILFSLLRAVGLTRHSPRNSPVPWLTGGAEVAFPFWVA